MKTKYTYFERTVPPDYYQAKAIVDILVKHNWTFVAVLYSADAYGTRGAEVNRSFQFLFQRFI